MPKISKSRWIAIICFFLILAPALAFADIEYYTYGGFDPVSAAFKRCALLFSVNGYKTFVAAIGILGILIAGLNLVVNTAFQRPTTGLGIFAPVILGGVIYLGLFTPTENVNVYDPVLNQNTSIASVPVGVTKPAYIINMVERWVIDTLDNNPSALGEPRYQDVGVRGWDAAAASMTAVVSSSNASQSLTKYTQDCVVFEMARSGGTLAVEDLCCPATGKSYFDVLGEAANPAIYTISYVNATGVGIPGGESVDCSTAYTRVKNFYTNSGNSLKDITNACTSQGFADTAQCQTVVGNILSQLQPLTNGPADAGTAVALNVGAQVVMETMASAGTDNAASFAVLQAEADKGRKGGIVSGIVNPRMIDAYVAYALVLTPILLILVVSPLSYRVLGFVINLYLWVLFARVADVICYHNWAAEVLRTAPTLTCHNTGAAGNAGIEYALGALPWMQSHLGSLADMRSSSFLLATMITGALFKFTDSSVARLADRGDQGANQALAGAGGYNAGGFKASTAEASGMTAAKQALATSNEDWSNLGKGSAASQFGSAATARGEFDAAGGAKGYDASKTLMGEKSMVRGAADASVNTNQKDAAVAAHKVGEGQDAYKDRDGNANGWVRKENPITGQNEYQNSDKTTIRQNTKTGGLTVGSPLYKQTANTAVSQGTTYARQTADSEANSAARAVAEESMHSMRKDKNDISTSKVGQTVANAQKRVEANQAAWQKTWQKTVGEDSTLQNTLGQGLQQGAKFDASVGLQAFKNGASVGYNATVYTENGQRHTVALTAKQADALNRNFAQTVTGSNEQSKTSTYGFENSSSVSAGQSYGISTKATQNWTNMKTRLDAATKNEQEAKTTGMVGGVDATTQFTKFAAQNWGYNPNSVEGLMMASDKISKMQSDGDLAGLAKLQEGYNQEYAKGMGIGKIQNEVEARLKAENPAIGNPSQRFEETDKANRDGYADAANPTVIDREGIVRKTQGTHVNTQVGAPKEVQNTEKKVEDRTNDINKSRDNFSFTPFGAISDFVFTPIEKGVNKFTGNVDGLGNGKQGRFGDTPSVEAIQGGQKPTGHSGEARLLNNAANTSVAMPLNSLMATVDLASNPGEYAKLYQQNGAAGVSEKAQSHFAPTLDERAAKMDQVATDFVAHDTRTKATARGQSVGNKFGLQMPGSSQTGGTTAGNMLAKADATPKIKVED